MRIISTPLPSAPEEIVDGRQAVLMAFDTLADDKGLIVGLTEGLVHGSDIESLRLSAIGVRVLERCRRHRDLNYPGGAVVVAGVATVAGAKQRVRDVLAKAPPGALVMLVCVSGKVYDAAFDALGIGMRPLGVGPQ